eukprot:m.28377 g.28377  ORF g.28377 m.28377 type:complete len:318 (+) comp30735_c0_seq2:103-1056(+)
MAAVANLNPTPQAISLIPVDRFLANPPPGITVSSNGPLSFTVTVDRKRAFFSTPTVYTTRGIKKRLKFVGHCGHVYRVRAEDRWDKVTRAILARPMYVMCKCKVQTDEDYNPILRRTTRYYTTADYVVRLETQTAPVRQSLREIFDQARQHIRNGERYSIKIDLSQCIGAWFEENRAQMYCAGTRQFDGAYFAMTNVSLPIYHSCTFEDDPVGCMSASLLCLPCVLFFCLPYYINRKCRYKDTKHAIFGEVKIIAGGPPLQSGTPRTGNPRHAASAIASPVAKPGKKSQPKAKRAVKKDSQQPLLEDEREHEQEESD